MSKLVITIDPKSAKKLFKTNLLFNGVAGILCSLFFGITNIYQLFKVFLSCSLLATMFALILFSVSNQLITSKQTPKNDKLLLLVSFEYVSQLISAAIWCLFSVLTLIIYFINLY